MTLAPPFLVMDLLGRAAHRLGKLPTLEEGLATPVEQRRALKPHPWLVPPRPAAVRVTDRTVPGRDGDVPVRLYAHDRPSGRVVLYLHGGGFMVGGPDACDHICADIADRTGNLVVSVDYRLAPEDPFPAGLDDCEDALLWLRKEADQLGVDGTRVAVAGDSAGGNLTAALCLRRPGGISAQVLIYPMLDLTCSRGSWVSETAPYLDRDKVLAYLHRYHGSTDVQDPCVSPLFATDLAGLPPATILTAQHDTLRDDGADYAEALHAAGVRVTYREYARMPHAFLSHARLSRNYRKALTAVCAAVS